MSQKDKEELKPPPIDEVRKTLVKPKARKDGKIAKIWSTGAARMSPENGKATRWQYCMRCDADNKDKAEADKKPVQVYIHSEGVSAFNVDRAAGICSCEPVSEYHQHGESPQARSP